MKYLVLGNGAAGVTAAAKLRELDKASSITVVSAEDVPAYAKIMLPDYIGGKIDKEKLFIRNISFYQDNNIKLLTDKIVTCIDTGKSEVQFSDDSTEEFEKLLVATGSVPFVPKIDGLDTIRYFTINSLKDADIIKNSVIPKKNAVIMGGGLTGIEVAFALQRLGMTVYVVEREKILLPPQLDEESSVIMEGHMGREGIHVITGAAVASIEPGYAEGKEKSGLTQAGTAVLANGQRVDFAMLVAAIGTRPGIQFASSAGIKCNRGIVIDEFLSTSGENIYAAGDVAEPAFGISNGFVSPYIWPNAMAQGKCAALNMTGTVQAYSGTGYAQNMTQLRDMQYVSMGLVKPKDDGYEIIKSLDMNGLGYKKFILRDNIFVGMILIGDVKNANAFASLIRKGTDVAAFKSRLTEPEFKL